MDFVIITDILLGVNISMDKCVNEKVSYYEKEAILSFLDTHPDALKKHFYRSDNNLNLYDFLDSYLFHGIRFGNEMEKFESILKDGKILAGNQINSYLPYKENCNEGAYVSLLELSRSSFDAVRAFLENNITFIIKPSDKAIKTMFISDFEWAEIKEKYKSFDNFNQRYSSIDEEYQVKDYVSLDDVCGIYVPFRISHADIDNLLEKYNLSNIPIIHQSLIQFTSRMIKEEERRLYEQFESQYYGSSIQDADDNLEEVNDMNNISKKSRCTGLSFTNNSISSGYRLLRKSDYKNMVKYKIPVVKKRLYKFRGN